MADLIQKAKDYFIVAVISERIGKFDVACSNYFKSLAAINDFVLSKKGLVAKDHNERFNLLKEKVKEAFEYAKITIPFDSEIEKYFKK